MITEQMTAIAIEGGKGTGRSAAAGEDRDPAVSRAES